jgi:predicted ATP-dependent endonuclease of OLD family
MAQVKISSISLKHFASIEDLNLTFRDTIMLVGQNNAGKSNVMKALDIFFNPSASKITEDSFYARDTSMPIEITIVFTNLNAKEEEYFSSYTRDHSLKVKRRIEWDPSSSKPRIHHIGYGLVPTVDWLREDKISGGAIDGWWSDRGRLSVAGVSFTSNFGSKPAVAAWKEAAVRFIEEHRELISFQEIERENGTGYEGVLKGGLPKFIMLPAVRDVLEEAKVGRTNPFGELIFSILELIPEEDRAQLTRPLDELSGLLNPQGGARRMRGITALESKLNGTLAELIPGCQLQLEIQTPSVRDIFSNIRIIADDGFRGAIEGKGHGLQRYVIFTILKTYAERSRETGDAERQRSVIFAIEEPEIYLHPQAQRTMYQALLEIGEKGDQVIYSTHSSLLVDIMHFDRLCLVSRRKIGDRYRTEVRQLSVQQMVNDLKIRNPQTSPTEQSMRERYSHVYTSSRNEGFFAQKIILVEGQSEEYAFPVYCQTLGYDLDLEGVSVINAGGKGLLDRLLRLYNEFGIPCYVVFDGDSGTEDPGNKRETKELLEVLGHSQTEPSNTIIEQRFTMFEKEFEETLKAEVPDYSSLVQEAKRVLGLTGDSGAPLISKYVTTKLVQKGRAEGDDSKYVPPTIVGIINKVKELEWTSSLLRTH